MQIKMVTTDLKRCKKGKTKNTRNTMIQGKC